MHLCSLTLKDRRKNAKSSSTTPWLGKVKNNKDSSLFKVPWAIQRLGERTSPKKMCQRIGWIKCNLQTIEIKGKTADSRYAPNSALTWDNTENPY